MSFSATYMVINLRMELLGQKIQSGHAYSWDGVAVAAASAVQVGEAWWNHVSAVWRALALNDNARIRFASVQVREVGGSLSLGEYAIPLDEQNGTRSATGLGDVQPSFLAVGTRLTVGSSVTRPGQKRLPFLCEADTVSNSVQTGFLTLCTNLMDVLSVPMILGAPVALGELIPAVISFGADQNTVDAGQDIVGYLLNEKVTSQVSRRYGHGS